MTDLTHDQMNQLSEDAEALDWIARGSPTSSKLRSRSINSAQS